MHLKLNGFEFCNTIYHPITVVYTHHSIIYKTRIREALFFGSRQLKVAEMDGRAPKKKRETFRKRSAGAADDQDFSRIARSKKTQFSPPSKRTGGLTGTKKKPFPCFFASWLPGQYTSCFVAIVLFVSKICTRRKVAWLC